MNLKRDFQTFYIVETVINCGTFEIGLGVYFALCYVQLSPPQIYVFEQTYGGQGVECDGLNMLCPWCGTVRNCGLVGVGVALLEEVCHCGGGL